MYFTNEISKEALGQCGRSRHVPVNDVACAIAWRFNLIEQIEQFPTDEEFTEQDRQHCIRTSRTRLEAVAAHHAVENGVPYSRSLLIYFGSQYSKLNKQTI